MSMTLLAYCAILLGCLQLGTLAAPLAAPGSPIVLVPGIGGSQVWAKLDLKKTKHELCRKKTKDFIPIWVELKELIKDDTLDCSVDELSLVYNFTDHTTTNKPGVAVSIPGFGDTKTIEVLNESKLNIIHYFKKMVTATVSWGYVRNISIRGAPYDFRRAPNEMGAWFLQLKDMIEETYQLNDNRSITLVGHSLGASSMLYFLNHQTQAWKDQYIRRYVSIAGPYAGAVVAVEGFTSGYNLGTPNLVLPPLDVRPLERTMPSIAFLLPTEQFWNQSEPVVTTTSKNYSIWDLDQMFDDMKAPVPKAMYHDTKDLISSLEPPKTEVHCIMGTGVKTIERIHYDGKKNHVFPNDLPSSFENGDGDGTVNARSLETCPVWAGQQTQKVATLRVPGVTHFGLVENDVVINYLKSLVLGS